MHIATAKVPAINVILLFLLMFSPISFDFALVAGADTTRSRLEIDNFFAGFFIYFSAPGRIT